MKNSLYFPTSFPCIHTKRLQLRKVEFSDVADVHAYLSDDEVRKYMGIHAYKTIEETRKEIEWYNEIFHHQTGIRWGISMKNDSTIIGSCGFLNISSSNVRAEIGYELHKAYWNKGIMSEVFEAIIQYRFEKMNLNRIEALIEPENISSVKLVEKYQFVQEGLLRQYEFGAGKYDDLYMFSLLKREYEHS